MDAEYEAWCELPNNDHITEAFAGSAVHDDWDEEREAKNEYEATKWQDDEAPF